jgi:hypothetical protein
MTSTTTTRVTGTRLISMQATDLGATWTVLETEAVGNTSDVVRTVRTNTRIKAGPVELGVDAAGRRHLLVPLLPGEAVAEDRDGRGVQLWRLKLDQQAVLSLVCITPALHPIFERLATEVLRDAVSAASPARRITELVTEWKELLAPGGRSETISNERLAGLIGELLCLERIVQRDDLRRVDSWSGPSGHQHDLLYGPHAVEVKALLSREGRIVTVNSVDQLSPAPAKTLHLVVIRLLPAPADGRAAETLPAVVKRILDSGANATELYRRLKATGYTPADEDGHRDRAFMVTEFRVYEASANDFPRIVRSSFVGGDIPAGTMRLSYSLDLTNEPPVPLTQAEVDDLWTRLASASP